MHIPTHKITHTHAYRHTHTNIQQTHDEHAHTHTHTHTDANTQNKHTDMKRLYETNANKYIGDGKVNGEGGGVLQTP